MHKADVAARLRCRIHLEYRYPTLLTGTPWRSSGSPTGQSLPHAIGGKTEGCQCPTSVLLPFLPLRGRKGQGDRENPFASSHPPTPLAHPFLPRNGRKG